MVLPPPHQLNRYPKGSTNRYGSVTVDHDSPTRSGLYQRFGSWIPNLPGSPNFPELNWPDKFVFSVPKQFTKSATKSAPAVLGPFFGRPQNSPPNSPGNLLRMPVSPYPNWSPIVYNVSTACMVRCFRRHLARQAASACRCLSVSLSVYIYI